MAVVMVVKKVGEMGDAMVASTEALWVGPLVDLKVVWRVAVRVVTMGVSKDARKDDWRGGKRAVWRADQ